MGLTQDVSCTCLALGIQTVKILLQTIFRRFAGIAEAEQDILNYVQSQARNGVKVSVKYLTERFAAKPYGWPITAILCLTSSLSAKGKLEARSDSTVLEGADLARNLNNSHALANILLTPQVEFSAAQIRKAKELYKELFDLPSDGSDARSIGAEWIDSIRTLSEEISRLISQKAQYPFLTALEPMNIKIASMVGKPAAWYLGDRHKTATSPNGPSNRIRHSTPIFYELVSERTERGRQVSLASDTKIGRCARSAYIKKARVEFLNQLV